MQSSPHATHVQLLGVPFDSTSTYRPGSRFGPAAIREAFHNIEIYSRELDIDLETIVVDEGDDLSRTSSMEAMLSSVQDRVSDILSNGCTPGVLGGEHTATLGSLAAFPRDLTLLVFDAHLDVRKDFEGLSTMHATWLRRAVEMRPDMTVIHVGGRAATPEEWSFIKDRGFSVISPSELAGGKVRNVGEMVMAGSPVYVSVDLDVLDPAYAPGVGNPEVSGISTRELIGLLQTLKGISIQGFDIMELSPPYDPSGISAVAAAKVLSELCCLSYLCRR